jgi:hypothetical protein
MGCQLSSWENAFKMTLKFHEKSLKKNPIMGEKVNMSFPKLGA